MSSTSLASRSSAILNRSKRILSLTRRRNEDGRPEERGDEEHLLALLAVAGVLALEAQRERGQAGVEQVGARLVEVCPAAADLAARNDRA